MEDKSFISYSSEKGFQTCEQKVSNICFRFHQILNLNLNLNHTRIPKRTKASKNLLNHVRGKPREVDDK